MAEVPASLPTIICTSIVSPGKNCLPTSSSRHCRNMSILASSQVFSWKTLPIRVGERAFLSYATMLIHSTHSQQSSATLTTSFSNVAELWSAEMPSNIWTTLSYCPWMLPLWENPVRNFILSVHDFILVVRNFILRVHNFILHEHQML